MYPYFYFRIIPLYIRIILIAPSYKVDLCSSTNVLYYSANQISSFRPNSILTVIIPTCATKSILTTEGKTKRKKNASSDASSNCSTSSPSKKKGVPVPKLPASRLGSRDPNPNFQLHQILKPTL